MERVYKKLDLSKSEKSVLVEFFFSTSDLLLVNNEIISIQEYFPLPSVSSSYL